MSIIGRCTVVALFFVGAAALDCPTGQKQITSTGYCTGDNTDAANCGSCCQDDTAKCKGVTGTPCGTNQFSDPTKWGVAATAANYVANCCTDVAACPTGSGHCEAGYKAKASITGLYCFTSATTAVSCNHNCCELDTTKCRGVTGTPCGTNKYADPTKYGVAATAANFVANCCTDQAACPSGSGHCNTGYTAKASVTGLYCATSATTADSCNANCCDLDTTKCRGVSATCGANKYEDYATWGTPATTQNFVATCCKDSATCQSFFTYTAPVGTSSFAYTHNANMAVLMLAAMKFAF